LKKPSLLTLLAHAAEHDLEIEQMDVKSAFLNGILKEEIYMEPPPGLAIPDGMVLRLKKTIYGLRQAPREWYECILKIFVKLGYRRSDADHSVFIKNHGQIINLVAIYVDDLLLFSNSKSEAARMKVELGREYEMKDLGNARWFLGMEITRDRTTRSLALSQRQYITTILARFGMENAKPLNSPLAAGLKLERQESPTVNLSIYQSMLGSAMYAMVGTRPDIAFAMCILSQHSTAPGPAHLSALKRVYHYLSATKDFVLEFNGNTKDKQLVGYVDSDWASDPIDRKSVTGYVFLMNGAAISWGSKKQPTVALSSTEGEYMASAQSTREAVWLRQLLTDIGQKTSTPTTLFIDNQSAIAIARNPTFHARSKHIEVRHHFVREKLADNTINLEYIPTNDQVADILTKGLPVVKHDKFRTAMGLSAPSSR
jgi:hypothetical protein